MRYIDGVYLNGLAGGSRTLKAVGGILGRAGDNGHGEDLLSVDDHGAALLHVGERADRLEVFEGEHNVSLTLLNDGGVEGRVVRHANVGDYAAAALAHAVDLADANVITVVHGKYA